jgi:hypothetical protein
VSGARIRIRPSSGDVLHPNGAPVKGVRLEGAKLVRVPELGKRQTNFVRALALVASGKSPLTTDDIVALHALARRARRARQSASESRAELLDEMQERPQTLDLTKCHFRTPVRHRPGPSLAASAALAPPPPRGPVSVSVQDGGVARDRRGRPIDGVRFDFASGQFVRVQRYEDELAALQLQEDELAADRASGGVRGLVKRGFETLAARLDHLERRPDRIVVNVPRQAPPVVTVSVPAPVVHVAAPKPMKAPDVHVTVQAPRPGAVRMEIDDMGVRRFIPEDES